MEDATSEDDVNEVPVAAVDEVPIAEVEAVTVTVDVLPMEVWLVVTEILSDSEASLLPLVV